MLASGLSAWRGRDGGSPGWRLHDGILEIVPGTGDLISLEQFTDFGLHLEFWLPWMPEARGQDRSNSGVFLQGRYEIQLLDSWGDAPADDCCGAIYKTHPPRVNASLPPRAWQRLDVAFVAPRPGVPAYATVHLNGVLIHDVVPIPRPTPGAIDGDVLSPGPLLLQDHGARLRFRNIRIVY